MAPNEIESIYVVKKINKYIDSLKKEHPKIVAHHIVVFFLEEGLSGIGIQGHADCPEAMADIFSESIIEQAKASAEDINQKFQAKMN